MAGNGAIRASLIITATILLIAAVYLRELDLRPACLRPPSFSRIVWPLQKCAGGAAAEGSARSFITLLVTVVVVLIFASMIAWALSAIARLAAEQRAAVPGALCTGDGLARGTRHLRRGHSLRTLRRDLADAPVPGDRPAAQPARRLRHPGLRVPDDGAARGRTVRAGSSPLDRQGRRREARRGLRRNRRQVPPLHAGADPAEPRDRARDLGFRRARRAGAGRSPGACSPSR